MSIERKVLNMTPVSVIIPAYKPDQKLIQTLSDLVEVGFSDILVVDDGSGEDFSSVFSQVAAIPQCTLLRHPVNRGKGAALKTAMTFFLDNRTDHAGVVTADADGQHLAEDIVAVAKTMQESGNITLGVRDFSDPKVPARSKAGNRITIAVFRLFFGMKISDTQTGLRAFPRNLLPEIVRVKGDRYEFETEMLFVIKKHKLPFDEVGISTVYIEDNQSSHFRVVWDSIRIYSLILKYLFSSIGAAVIDEGTFYLFKKLLGSAAILAGFLPSTFVAAFFARVISSLIKYLVNAKVVFEGKTSKQTLLRYYILAVAQIIVSAAVVFLFEHLLSISSAFLSTLIKIVVDTVLFFFSFRIQHIWVFNDTTSPGERTSAQ